MTLSKRQLPIASPCQEFVGRRATAAEPAFCTRCEKSVHDLSRLTEDEVITLLAKHRGGRVCVSYRARADGSIATRPVPSRFAPAALAVSLAGCAGHLSEADRTTQSECVDAEGYGTDCPPKPRLADAVIPDELDPPVAKRPPVVKDRVVAPPEDLQVAGGIMVPDGPVEPTPLYPGADEIPVDGEIVVPEGEELRGDVALAGEPMISPVLQRRIAKEAKRLERREARKERRLARR